MTKQFFCPYLDSEVELTEERELHIVDTHPDLLPSYQERIAKTLADPDFDVIYVSAILFYFHSSMVRVARVGML